MDFSFSDLNYNFVETLPGFEPRAAFTVNSSSVFKEDVDIVNYIPDSKASPSNQRGFCLRICPILSNFAVKNQSHRLMLKLTSKSARIVYSIIACLLFMFIYFQSWKVTAILGLYSASLLKFIVGYSIMFIAVIILTAIVIKPKDLFSFLGLNCNIASGFCISLICVIPGFMEEFMFRAFMFGLLFRYAKTGFFWAVILPALLFGSLHLFQGHDALSSLAAFGVTFIGA